MKGRAERRFQMQRAKARATRTVRMLGFAESHPKMILHRAVDRVTCSCPMCGNPRKWTGEATRQERKADAAREAESSR